MKIKIVLTILSLFFVGCSTITVKEFKPEPLEDLTLSKTDSYTVDLTAIPKPEKINNLYGVYKDDGTILIVDDALIADFVILSEEEYSKVGQLVSLNVSYKNIIMKQEELVNENIKIINSVKELAELERKKTQEYQKLWVDSENLFRHERAELSKNDKENKFMNFISQLGFIGSILALSL